MRAVKIDRTSKTVEFDNGDEIGYDQLIIATGTRPRKLQFDAIDDSDVFYIRTKADADSINIADRSGQKILFLGGGYIGLEAAASATKMGLDVTLVEAQDRLLKRVTSEPVSDFYLKLHQDAGVNVLINTMVDDYEKTETGYRAITKDGKSIDFDCLVVGIGVIPNQELAEECGIECDNGILVNEFTETNDPNIYAIGDCCNHPSAMYGKRIRLESIPNANGQAKTTALAITGNKKPYADLPWFWSDQYDVKLQTVGLFNDFDKLEVEGEPSEKKFAVKYFKDDQLIAVDAINMPKAFMLGKKEITSNFA
jgi:3-phenylpropionate/trans-cinnamate dioxygenase ferredoxin reductase subunit